MPQRQYGRRPSSTASRLPHGKRTECAFVEFMEDRCVPGEPIRAYLYQFYNDHHVHPSVFRRWWKHYLCWGETPSETREKSKQYKKLLQQQKRTAVITDGAVATLKEIGDDHPEYYLDEIAVELGVRRNVYLNRSTIYRTLVEKVGYSLKVAYETALQRDEVQRARYKDALESLVQNIDQLIFIDETHKDRNSARRRRAWGKRNNRGRALRRWFQHNVRYTLIAAMDINGFLESTLEIIKRDEISETGAGGTVNSQHFENWIENHLLPFLGNYENSEPRSIVVMDNASTHLGRRVEELIQSKGAYLLYTAPYSPDLNPIEYAFNTYKSELKRSYGFGYVYWYDVHISAIHKNDIDMCINNYRKCGIPLSESTLTSEEENQKRMAEKMHYIFLLLLASALFI